MVCTDGNGRTASSDAFTFSVNVNCNDAKLYEVRTDGLFVIDKYTSSVSTFYLADLYRKDPSCPNYNFLKCMDDIGCSSLTSFY